MLSIRYCGREIREIMPESNRRFNGNITSIKAGPFDFRVCQYQCLDGWAAGERSNLTVVESVTTAIGLFVAIPAVWMFNYFTNRIEAFDVEMGNSSSELIDYFLKRTQRVAK